MNAPWQRARIQQRSQAQEKRVGSSPGGKKQINSGRVWFAKRDTKKFEFLVENRLIGKAKQYTLKAEELAKLTRDAFFHKNLPAMNIEFEDAHENWMLIRYVDFDDMNLRIAELEASVINLKKELDDGRE